ncbi:MAG: sulfite exporter TauE/SafE family protein [Betaproteobacteria bacterium]
MESFSWLEMAYFAMVVFLSYSMRGSTGLGAVGMPFLALVFPLKVLVPAWTMLGAASSIVILGRDRRHVAWREFAVLAPWCVAGIFIGLYFFKTLDSRMLARSLGALILAYGLYSLWASIWKSSGWRPPLPLATSIAGTLSGMVGTVFGTMASVFFAMYLDVARTSKHAFRATMSAMLLTLSVLRAIGYYAIGEFTREVLVVFSVAFPLMLLGIYVGDRIHVRINEVMFRRLVSAMFILCGVSLIAK